MDRVKSKRSKKLTAYEIKIRVGILVFLSLTSIIALEYIAPSVPFINALSSILAIIFIGGIFYYAYQYPGWLENRKKRFTTNGIRIGLVVFVFLLIAGSIAVDYIPPTVPKFLVSLLATIIGLLFIGGIFYFAYRYRAWMNSSNNAEVSKEEEKS